MTQHNHDGYGRNVPAQRGADVQGRLWVNQIPCGIFHKMSPISRPSDTTFPLFLGASSHNHMVIHRNLWIAELAMGVVAPKLTSEGHPRSNGDGPLTHITRPNRERG